MWHHWLVALDPLVPRLLCAIKAFVANYSPIGIYTPFKGKFSNNFYAPVIGG